MALSDVATRGGERVNSFKNQDTPHVGGRVAGVGTVCDAGRRRSAAGGDFVCVRARAGVARACACVRACVCVCMTCDTLV